MARGVGGPEEWSRLFAKHSRSFRFASLLFPGDTRRTVTGIYVFCRFTDDLVDATPEVDAGLRRLLLEAWRQRVDDAYWKGRVGIPLLDAVVTPAGETGIPFGYLDGLLSGVAEDLEPREYPDLDALRQYTYRVASVVGGWVTEALGVRDPVVLRRAFALGHAMQVTNILRDVGEDLRAGRLYLPLDRMAAHGLTRAELEKAARGHEPVPAGFPALVEELMGVAESEYRHAFEGIPALPSTARLAVAAAARIYRGIHREIRRNDYDTLTRRAYTSLPRKAWLAAGAAGSLIALGARGSER